MGSHLGSQWIPMAYLLTFQKPERFDLRQLRPSCLNCFLRLFEELQIVGRQHQRVGLKKRDTFCVRGPTWCVLSFTAHQMKKPWFHKQYQKTTNYPTCGTCLPACFLILLQIIYAKLDALFWLNRCCVVSVLRKASCLRACKQS